MAFITAETRSELVALSVAMLKQAPSNTLLEELIGISVAGGTLADAADHIAKTAAFKAEYPSFQTAAQYAAEIFDAFSVGGTVTAALRTEVIDLATGLLTSGQYTKASLASAISSFLLAPAALENEGLADIAQAHQNRSAAAEYYVITKELGGKTDAELAAVISSVTSDAATLTAAKAAADAVAVAVAVVPGKTFTLTTGLNTFTGEAGDDAFNTIATGLSAGDVLDGGDGTDTLTFTDNVGGMNISVPSVTVKNIENVAVSTTGSLGVTAVAGTTAVAQVNTYVFGAPTAATDSLVVNYGSVATTMIGGADATAAGAAFAAAINNAARSNNRSKCCRNSNGNSPDGGHCNTCYFLWCIHQCRNSACYNIHNGQCCRCCCSHCRSLRRLSLRWTRRR